MAADSTDSPESNTSLRALWSGDEWFHDVAVMSIGWLLATVISVILLLYIGPIVF